MPERASPDADRVRTAEVVAALSLATDLGIGIPLEYGLRSTLLAMRLCELMRLEPEPASQVYYTCLLYYVGCTASAATGSELFGADDALTTYGTPVRFGSPAELITGMLRAVAPPGAAPWARAVQLARGAPRLARAFPDVAAADCEAAQMLTTRLGLPVAIAGLFAHANDRWDGRGSRGAGRERIPLPMRVVHVARDAAFQCMIGGTEQAVRMVRRRAGGAFDPDVARLLADTPGILAANEGASAWQHTLAREPGPSMTLSGEAIEGALGAMGDFADLASPYLVGHSAGVAELVTAAARRCRLAGADVVAIRRAAFVHDLGRVAVPVRIWQQTAPLSPDDWERVRLHAYHTERVLDRSPFLAALASLASRHHERLDGSGYHRGTSAAALAMPARLLAAADVFHAMTEPRPHRAALSAAVAAERLTREARAGRLDPEAVASVLAVAGQRVPRIERPAGLTEREVEVVGLLARGRQTKQVARVLGISVKTADRHVQNAYRKMGVSTRAGAALFAMEHGLTTWGELPIGVADERS